jgi:hypothetical protein
MQGTWDYAYVERAGGQTGGREKWGWGKEATRPEHLANRVQRKVPNGEFGQGTVVCGRMHWGILEHENSRPGRFAKDFRWKILAAAFFEAADASLCPAYREDRAELGSWNFESPLQRPKNPPRKSGTERFKKNELTVDSDFSSCGSADSRQ